MASTKQIKFFRYKFFNDQAWRNRAIVALYERQTEDEQNIENTNHNNDRGFNKPDAPQMTKYAKILLDDGNLSKGQSVDATKRLMKYAGQLARVANYKYYQKKNNRKI